MAKLQYGDTVKFPESHNDASKINGIQDVVPIRFDTIEEQWVVCEQSKATHMLIIATVTRIVCKTEYIMIEIGKCENLYLLADAIVD